MNKQSTTYITFLEKLPHSLKKTFIVLKISVCCVFVKDLFPHKNECVSIILHTF